MISDRSGNFEVWADDWQLVEHYRFGTGTCDFLICRRCGVFIAAIAKTPAGTQAVANVNCLEDSERFTSDPVRRDSRNQIIAAGSELDACFYPLSVPGPSQAARMPRY